MLEDGGGRWRTLEDAGRMTLGLQPYGFFQHVCRNLHSDSVVMCIVSRTVVEWWELVGLLVVEIFGQGHPQLVVQRRLQPVETSVNAMETSVNEDYRLEVNTICGRRGGGGWSEVGGECWSVWIRIGGWSSERLEEWILIEVNNRKKEKTASLKNTWLEGSR